MGKFFGKFCEINDDFCEVFFCLNGGICKYINVIEFNCICDVGFIGKMCEENVNDCLFVLCLVNFDCIDLVNDYKCVCYLLYIGFDCGIGRFV